MPVSRAGTLRRRSSSAHATAECARISGSLWLRIAARARRLSAGRRRDHSYRHRCSYEGCPAAGEVFEGLSGGAEETGWKTLLNALHINGNDLTLEAVREVAAERRPVLFSADPRELVHPARAAAAGA